MDAQLLGPHLFHNDEGKQMITFSRTSRCMLAMACVSLTGCGETTDAPSRAMTAPGIEVQTQSSYAQGNQPLSDVLTQVQRNYRTQLENGQTP